MSENKHTDLNQLRVDYQKGALRKSDVAADPFEQFVAWFDEARAAKVPEPNAMTLATADAFGKPSARVVLLKDYDDRGFTFFTNYDSAKAADLAANPRASLCFFWHALERQVRIDGTVEKVSRQESADYWVTRPYKSQIGSAASQQSRPIADRQILEDQFARLEHDHPETIPLPERWGGYRVTPTVIEFWQGGRSRLHDRIVYRREDTGWKIERLSP